MLSNLLPQLVTSIPFLYGVSSKTPKTTTKRLWCFASRNEEGWVLFHRETEGENPRTRTSRVGVNTEALKSAGHWGLPPNHWSAGTKSQVSRSSAPPSFKIKILFSQPEGSVMNRLLQSERVWVPWVMTGDGGNRRREQRQMGTQS